MALFDQMIKETLDLLAPLGARRYGFNPDRSAREGDPNDLILKRDMAYELGEGSFSSTSLTAITQDEKIVSEDGIYVIGKELKDLTEDGPFARVTIIRTDDIYQKGDQAAYNLIKSLETQKFRVSPEGYMVRASAMNNREQVRVSKKALKKGLCFEEVGNLLIKSYHVNPRVEAVSVFFITLPEAPYTELDQLADKLSKVVKTLNHALISVSMDCRACEWKPVCDSVEGMKELHQKQIDQAFFASHTK